jgi:hybrid cluster-associated redox disulfide protein
MEIEKMITKDMTIGEIVRLYPRTLEVFSRFGLDCFECQVADFEKLEHGAGVHQVDVEKLVEELNRIVTSK